MRARSFLAVLVVLTGCAPPSPAPDAASPLDTSAETDAAGRADTSSHDAPAPVACDLEAQTGCLATEKCTLVASDRGDVRGCVPLRGEVPLGEPCTRAAEGFGHDDCAAGSTCTFIGVLPPRLGGTRRCRALCTGDAACAPDERCALLTTEPPSAGFCGQTCEPFGTACTTPLECTRLWPAVDDDPPGFLTCRAAGEVAEGMPCSPVAEDCASGLVCFGGFGTPEACVRPCDAAHPCAEGSCSVLDEASTFGVCL